MKTDFRFGQFFVFAGFLLSIFGFLIAVPLLFIYNLHHVEGFSSYSVIFPLSWYVPTLFGLRARRQWAYQFNQVLLALATAACLCTFVFVHHPALILGSLLFASCFILFYRARHLFPERVRKQAREVLSEYTVSEKERRIRRHWFIWAILLVVVFFVLASLAVVGAIVSDEPLAVVPVFIVGLLTVGWRFLVIGCARNAWGTRMALWETLSASSFAIGFICDAGPKALLLYYAGYRWPPVIGAFILACAIAYFIASYRLRQINLRFRARREALASATEPKPSLLPSRPL